MRSSDICSMFTPSNYIANIASQTGIESKYYGLAVGYWQNWSEELAVQWHNLNQRGIV